MVAVPDPATFQILPWKPGGAGRAHVLRRPQPRRHAVRGRPPRRAEAAAQARRGPRATRSTSGPSSSTSTSSRRTTRRSSTTAATSTRRRSTSPPTTASDRAVPRGDGHRRRVRAPRGGARQHEIDLRYTDALTMADNVMTYRLTVKEVAQAFGIYATFMPKPVAGENGSGMHTHQSLFNGDRNAFFDARRRVPPVEDRRSPTSPGCCAHAPEITLVTNQWVNSYKRLVPGYEAPVYVCWARRNRSALIRVPMYKPGKEGATRIEYRSPDPACNPYLAFAAMLAAGLAGIEGEYELPARGQQQHLRDDRGRAHHAQASAHSPRTSSRRSTSPRSPRCSGRPWASTSTSTSSATSARSGTRSRPTSPLRAGALPAHPLGPLRFSQWTRHSA